MLNLSKSSSRIKDFNGSHIFENVICYDCNQLESPTLQWLFPPHLDDKLKTIIPEFALPVPNSGYSPKHNGFIDYTKSSSNTQDLPVPYTYHAFALTTDECGHLLFGFCYMSHNVLLVILSYRPWYTPFYKLLTQISGSFIEGSFDNDSYSFLTKIYQHPYKVSHGENDKEYNQIREGKFSFIYKNPDLLDNPLSDGVPAIIPTNRQFTELYNCLSESNLITAWTSMLYERRVILVSSKLNRLSSVALSLLYLLFPLQWQHIFIPILPQKLIETVSAPIPFLIDTEKVEANFTDSYRWMSKFEGIDESICFCVVGLPRHVYESTEIAQSTKQQNNDCGGENVITIVDLDADQCTFYDANLQNSSQNPGPTCNQVPAFVIAPLKKRLLPKFSSPSATVLPGSIHIGEAFLLAMVELIGDYRNGLAFEPGTEISFQPDTLLRACRPSARTCLEQILKTQMFEQFISERLQLLNSGYGFDDVFEREVNIGETENNKFSQMQKYKDWLGYMKSEGDFYLKSLKSRSSSTSVTLLKNVPTLDWAYSNIKSKGKSAYNMVRQLKPFNNNASSCQSAKKAREILPEKGTEFYCDFIKNDLTPNGQNGITGHSATQPNRSGVVRNFSKAVSECKSLPYNWKSGWQGPNGIYGGTSKESPTLENKHENGMVLIPQNTPDRQMGLDRDPHLPSNQNFANGTNQSSHVKGSSACNGLPKLPSPQGKPRRRNCRKAVPQSLIDLDSTPSGPDLGRLAADRLLEEFGNINFNDYKDSPNAKNADCLPNVTGTQNGFYKPSLNGYNPAPNVMGRLNGFANGHSTEANSTATIDYLTTLLPNYKTANSQTKQYQQSWETFD